MIACQYRRTKQAINRENRFFELLTPFSLAKKVFLIYYPLKWKKFVIAIIDDNGDVAESYTYTVYGEVTVFDSNGNELSESALGNRYTFQGREIDYTTGLYNFRARWYDPETGRWLASSASPGLREPNWHQRWFEPVCCI
jgi:RHS repeat-associated protein